MEKKPSNDWRINLIPSAQDGHSNQGEVVSVRGSVVDVRFVDFLPKIHNLLKAGEAKIEVLIHLSPEMVRGIALTPTQGLARGSLVIDTGQPIMVPVGETLLGRVFNVFGSPIEHKEQVEVKEIWSIHREFVPLS
jgi:F-type H+/Na+-transporting ATPase subunit beta